MPTSDNLLSVVIGGGSLCFKIRKGSSESESPQILLDTDSMFDDFQRKIEKRDIFKDNSTAEIGIINPHIVLRPDTEDIEKSYEIFYSLNPAWQGKYLMHSEHPELGINAIYSVPDDYKERMQELFHVTNFSHILPHVLNNISEEFIAEDHLRIHVSGDLMCVILLTDSQLQYYNIFKFESKEDFIYFCNLTANQENLELNDVKIMLSGRIKENGKIFKLLLRYNNKAEFIGSKDEHVFLDLKWISQ